MPQALVIFTDASGSGNTAYFSSQGQMVVQTGFSTAQCVELQAVILGLSGLSLLKLIMAQTIYLLPSRHFVPSTKFFIPQAYPTIHKAKL
jgi:hypothetical protein